MNKSSSLALAVLASISAGGAHAGGNVYWSAGITAPALATVTPGYYAPAPLYAYSPPVAYALPPRVYYQAPVVYERAPQVVYVRRVWAHRHAHRRHWENDRDRCDPYDNRLVRADHGLRWRESYGINDSRRYGY